MGDSRVGVGLIGLGTIARAHVTALDALAGEGAGVRIGGYVGRRAAAEALGLAGEPSTVPELLERDDIDLVVDLSPSPFHAEHAIAALRAGTGIVAEKPLATTAADARRVVAVAEETGGFGSVMAQRRFEPQHAWLRDHLASGSLGEVVAASATLPWWRDEAYFAAGAWRGEAPGGIVLLNQGIHSVDLLAWLLGDPVDAVGFGVARRRPGGADDTAAGAIRFAGGALATVLATTRTPPGAPATLSVHTTRGTASFSQADVVAWTFPDVPPPPATSAVRAGASDPRAIGHAGHTDQWRDILEAYTQGRTPSVTLRDGLRAVALCEALTSGGTADSSASHLLG